MGVQFIEVEDHFIGQRIDNFLLARLKGVPKSRVYKVLRKGEVRVNKSRVKPEYRLRSGDIVRVPPITVSTTKPLVAPSQSLSRYLLDNILFENDGFLVVNKPSGLAVHGGSGVSLGLIEALRQLRPEQKMLELVHRLDRETSGCVMIAKKRSALKYLQDLLREKDRIEKTYQALVLGRWPKRRHQVDAPLRKSEEQNGGRVVRVKSDGKPSLTRFSVVESFHVEPHSLTLVQAVPVTGRTHQIRVHAQYVGHSLVGDEKYGDDELNKLFKSYGVNRLFLHAMSLRIPCMEGGDDIVVNAPLESSLNRALESLRRIQVQ
ncbi:23S rRNA pseudouridine(955/2504/2580) synthase RluC [Marinibactrum halimedae]|uniref:Pseudouridine synthase n=1 Tax=Marinibactrum halimedae TaxID=1444977 RepID=A0AA37T9N4_9GAMM|nr:23S rRNA pseudouridine(955/2504/2580) synthase RluC [Marinibactrum halimedae]MCD9460115.1 23S rRNA pseudouridine(955/2504/2580) synthase RluC [Marinibactrum halimedae]GLS26516.1 pseudouridine synthase [Marinibactrum halimedae]